VTLHAVDDMRLAQGADGKASVSRRMSGRRAWAQTNPVSTVRYSSLLGEARLPRDLPRGDGDEVRRYGEEEAGVELRKGEDGGMSGGEDAMSRGEDGGMSGEDGGMSGEDSGMSGGEDSMSGGEDGMSGEDGGMSGEDSGMSREDGGMSGGEDGKAPASSSSAMRSMRGDSTGAMPGSCIT
jgi:hypothetical protein